MSILNTLFPKVPDRIHRSHAFWNGKKKGFATAIVITFVLLQILFLGNLSYLYGSLYKDADKAHNLNILLVDYDQGVVGESLLTASEQLQADSFPKSHIHSIAEIPHPSDIVRKVKRGDYWGGIYTHAGASERLSAALAGGAAASSYNTSDVVTYVFNGVRYPAVAEGYVELDLETLVSEMRIAYNQLNGSAAVRLLNSSDDTAVQILLDPFSASSIDIQPTEQGTRVLLNTVTMILPIIQQFFFLMALNGISAQFGFYQHLPIKHNATIRFILGLSYTLIGALSMTGYIWGFKEDWDVGGAEFMLTWMLCWLYMHINFLVMDVATGFIPPSFLSFFVLTWAVMNITSTIFPFALNSGFYRWGYFFPAHSAWEVLMHIWSHYGYNRLYRALPILFAWWVVMIPLAKSAMHWRCVKSAHDTKAQEVAFQAKLQEQLQSYSRDDAGDSSYELNQTNTGHAEGESTIHSGYNPRMQMPFVESIARNNTSSG